MARSAWPTLHPSHRRQASELYRRNVYARDPKGILNNSNEPYVTHYDRIPGLKALDHYGSFACGVTFSLLPGDPPEGHPNGQVELGRILERTQMRSKTMSWAPSHRHISP
jgi:hypothetical protein